MVDLGCCFGQELRRLVFDGAPATNLYGLDLRQEFFDLGYDLFVDEGKTDINFITGNIFTDTSSIGCLNGNVSVVYASAFFHLFDRPQQLQAAKLVSRLLKPVPNSMVLGRQVGSIVPGSYEHKTNPASAMYRHDVQSWIALWDEVGTEEGVKWDVEAELREVKRIKGDGLVDGNVRELWFCVRRL